MREGTTIGPFRLEHRIGQSGQSSVFRAIHTEDHTPVALKVMRPKSAQTVENFHREVSAAASLDHSCITAIFDYGVIGDAVAAQHSMPADTPWFAMELVEGTSLSALVGRLGWAELRQVLLDTLDGLAHAHSRAMLHLDIKPGNLLRHDYTLRTQITDFGLVRHAFDRWDLPTGQENMLHGTPAYMSPEQISLSFPDYGPWTDLYALGATAWRLCTGRPLYAGTPIEMLHAHLRGILPPFRPIIDVPQDFEAWLRTMLCLHPADRFIRAPDAAWALQQLKETATDMAPVDIPLALNACAMETLVIPKDSAPAALWPPADELLAPNRHAHPPCPPDWRPQRMPSRHLHSPGLSLIPMRSVGMVGREAERDALWQTLRAVHVHRSPKIVLLQGPHGVGKAALGQWLLQRVEEVGAAQYREYEADPAHDHTHFSRHMLSWNAWQEGAEPAVAVRRTRQLLQQLSLTPQHINDIIALTGLQQDDTPQTPPAISALTPYLYVLSQGRALVVFVRDLHHSPVSLSVLETIAADREDVPLLVVATMATAAEITDDIGQRLQALQQRPHVTTLPIGPLSTSATLTLLKRLGLHPRLAQQLATQCHGNPREAVATVHRWLDASALVPTVDGFVLANPTP